MRVSHPLQTAAPVGLIVGAKSPIAPATAPTTDLADVSSASAAATTLLAAPGAAARTLWHRTDSFQRQINRNRKKVGDIRDRPLIFGSTGSDMPSMLRDAKNIGVKARRRAMPRRRSGPIS